MLNSPNWKKKEKRSRKVREVTKIEKRGFEELLMKLKDITDAQLIPANVPMDLRDP